MKKEYIKPSMKAVELKTESMILAGSGNLTGGNAFTDKDAFESADEGVYFYDYENSNGSSGANWDF